MIAVLAPTHSSYRRYLSENGLTPNKAIHVRDCYHLKGLSRGTVLVKIDGWQRGFSAEDRDWIDTMIQVYNFSVVFVG